jgi:hypothetical protein
MRTDYILTGLSLGLILSFVGVILVLTDLVGSERVTDRDALRIRLHQVLEKANEDFHDDFVIPFQIVRGVDEFGAVLNDWRNSFRIVDCVFESLLPFVYRFAIVEGEIVNIEGGQIDQLDGEAVYIGSRLLEQMKEGSSGARRKTKVEFIRLAISGIDYRRLSASLSESLSVRDSYLACVGFALHALENMVQVIWWLKTRWTEKQRKIICRYRELKNQHDVARSLGISQSTVSQTLRRADFDFVTRLEKFVNQGLVIVPRCMLDIPRCTV